MWAAIIVKLFKKKTFYDWPLFFHVIFNVFMYLNRKETFACNHWQHLFLKRNVLYLEKRKAMLFPKIWTLVGHSTILFLSKRTRPSFLQNTISSIKRIFVFKTYPTSANKVKLSISSNFSTFPTTNVLTSLYLWAQ